MKLRFFTQKGILLQMELIISRKLAAGMVAAKDIVTKHGQTIVSKGTVLTDGLIARLSFYRIDSIYVEDLPKPKTEESPADPEVTKPSINASVTTVLTPEPEAVEEPKEEPVVTTPSARDTMAYTQKIKNTPEFLEFQVNYSRTVTLLSKILGQIIKGDYSFSFDTLLQEAGHLYHGKTNLEILDLLHTIRAVDDSVYAHSLNVALVSRTIGRWLKLSKEDLNVLTLAGLLHDIGKLTIPEEVLNKQGKLTDEEFDMIRQHPLTGNRLLKNVPGIDRRILAATLQHHERSDGSGYPRHLQQDEIDDFAAIVAIADVYDAMTAARAYRAPLCAFQVIESFERDGFQKYNPKFILQFLDHIASAYQNGRVVLSDGRSCRVIYINHRSLSRPMIQLDDGSVIDLAVRKDLHITAIL
ncbi:MAG: HD-GYP domain-containing protein [Lachnospiraceae bacterium]|nr:HD-GYP domain-containing protein [Lachnospiraceae bacterium]